MCNINSMIDLHYGGFLLLYKAVVSLTAAALLTADCYRAVRTSFQVHAPKFKNQERAQSKPSDSGYFSSDFSRYSSTL